MKNVVLAALALSMPVAANAQQQCAPREAVIEMLADQYGESRHVIGMTEDGLVMEVFGNTDSGTWTLTITRPDGLTCFVAAGQSFETISEAPQGATF